jgi:hypothetical protein
MALPAITLWADSVRGAFVADWQSNETLDALKLKQGDTLGVELHWVKKASLTNGSFMEEVIWPASANITLAIGLLDNEPKSGNFTLSYAGVATPTIPYDATATEMSVLLNALPGIIADGGVAVTKISTTYKIDWNNIGATSGTLATSANNLVPTCSIGLGVATMGTVSTRHSIQMHIKQSPVAVCTSWVSPVATTVVITQTHAPAYDGDYRVWRMVITPAPKEGTFRLGGTMAPNGDVKWSAPINVNSLNATSIRDAIGITVTEISANEFEIRQQQYTAGYIITDGVTIYNVLAIQADGAGLIGFSTKYGSLSLNTLDTELLLSGKTSADAYIEVEVEAGGNRQTLVQQTCTIVNDLIDTDSYTLVEWGDVIPADSVVRYDTSQALTTPQQTQARANINAISGADIASLQSSDVAIDIRVTNLEINGVFTQDERDAIQQSTTPSATNVFATQYDLTFGYAPLAHTHTASSVTGLTAALALKSDTTHQHTFADVSGLQVTIDSLNSGKSNTGHTHAIADVSGLQTILNGLNAGGVNAPSTAQKAAMDYSNSPGQTNPFATIEDVGAMVIGFSPYSGNLTATLYPYEILITIQGTQMAVPARIVV